MPKNVINLNKSSTTFFQRVKHGFGLGIGLSVAHNLLAGVSNFLFQSPAVKSAESASVIEYKKCLVYSSGDDSKCRSILKY